MTKADEYRKALRETVVDVTFTKKDGSERLMTCTLKPDFLPIMPVIDATLNTKASEDNITVWDLSVNNWRSFRTDSVKKFEYE